CQGLVLRRRPPRPPLCPYTTLFRSPSWPVCSSCSCWIAVPALARIRLTTSCARASVEASSSADLGWAVGRVMVSLSAAGSGYLHDPTPPALPPEDFAHGWRWHVRCGCGSLLHQRAARRQRPAHPDR